MLLSSHIAICNIAEECSLSGHGQISIYLIISVVCLIVSKIAIMNNAVLNNALYSSFRRKTQNGIIGLVCEYLQVS